MKKTRKGLSILLSLCIILAGVPMMGISSSASESIADNSFNNNTLFNKFNLVNGEDDPVCWIDTDNDGTIDAGETSFTTVSAAVSADATSNATIKLYTDVTEFITIPSGKTVTIDLNGKKIIQPDITDHEETIIVDGGSLTITDSNTSTATKFKKDADNKWVQDNENGTVTVKGGIITGAKAHAAFKLVNNGQLTMNGGNIAGNNIPETGSAVYIYSGTFTMNSGNILCNTADYGGAIGACYTAANFVMTGGTISNNVATSGGGVILKEGGSMTMTGGSINNNQGNGVCVEDDAGTITLGGSADITGNTKDGSVNNLFLETGKYATIGTPSDDMKVGVTLQSVSGKFTTNGTSEQTKYFTSDNIKYVVKHDTVDSNSFLKLTIDTDTDTDITVDESRLIAAVDSISQSDENPAKYKFSIKKVNSLGFSDGTQYNDRDSITYYTAKLTKTVGTNTPEEILATGDKLLSYSFTYDMTGKTDLAVYSIITGNDVNNQLEELKNDPVPRDNTYSVEVNNNIATITVYTNILSNISIATYSLPNEIKDASYYTSLTLNEKIDINLTMKGLGKDFDPKKLEVKAYYNDNNNENQNQNQGQNQGQTTYNKVDTIEMKSKDQNDLRAVIKSVEPYDMDNPIKVVIKYNDRTVKEITTSIPIYCNKVFKNKDKNSEIYKLCEALLTYGEWAKAYNTGVEPVYDDNNNPKPSYILTFDKSTAFGNYKPKEADKRFTQSDKITAAEASLTLGSEIQMNFILSTTDKLTKGLTANDIVILNSNNEQIDPADITVTKDGNYKVTVSKIGSARLARTYTVTVKGDKDFSLVYGVYTYCYDVATKDDGHVNPSTEQNLCMAIYTYGKAAEAYSGAA